jgi:hypothetical protein
MAAINTVKMVRGTGCKDSGPASADVHPSEVENWKVYGWVVVPPATETPVLPVSSPDHEPKRRKLKV